MISRAIVQNIKKKETDEEYLLRKLREIASESNEITERKVKSKTKGKANFNLEATLRMLEERGDITIKKGQGQNRKSTIITLNS